MTEKARAIPDGYHTVTPYLVVEDPDGLLYFLEQAFGAAVLSRHVGPDGRIMHAELRIGDSRVMMGGASEAWPPMPCMLHLYVEDVDALYRRAMGAGAQSLREPVDEPYGDRAGGVADPAGNQWWMATHLEDVSPEEIERRYAEKAKASEGGG